MFHKLYFFGRKPSLNQAGFHKHYLAVHTTAGTRIVSLKRYIQNHRLHSLGGDSPFDAMSEIWMEDFGESHREKGASTRIADEINFIDAGRTEWMTTTDRVIVEGRLHLGHDPGVVSIAAQARHAAGGFPLLLAGSPCSDRACAARSAALSAMPGRLTIITATANRIMTAWKRSGSTITRPRCAALNSVEYQRGFMPDLANFCESAPHFFAESQLVIWPGKGREQVSAEIKAKVAQGWRDVSAIAVLARRIAIRSFPWSTRFISSPASRP